MLSFKEIVNILKPKKADSICVDCLFFSECKYIEDLNKLEMQHNYKKNSITVSCQDYKNR